MTANCTAMYERLMSPTKVNEDAILHRHDKNINDNCHETEHNWTSSREKNSTVFELYKPGCPATGDHWYSSEL